MVMLCIHYIFVRRFYNVDSTYITAIMNVSILKRKKILIVVFDIDCDL